MAARDGPVKSDGVEYAPRNNWGSGTLGRYQTLDQIGEGTYGKVFKARNVLTGEQVALKKMERHHESEGFPRTETREIKILAGLRHPNMVLLKEIVSSIDVAKHQAAARKALVADGGAAAGGAAVGGDPAASPQPEPEVSFEKMGDVYMVGT